MYIGMSADRNQFSADLKNETAYTNERWASAATALEAFATGKIIRYV
jgi:hypothetical protein